MKKVVYIIASILQIALLAGTYIFHYFTVKKQGMNRFVNFYNMKWNKTYPLDELKWIMIIGIVCLTILLLGLYWKKKENQILGIRCSVAVMTAMSFVYVGFTLLQSVEKLTSYYFVSLMLATAALIQIIKVFGKLVRK